MIKRIYITLIIALVFSCSIQKDVSDIDSINDNITQLIVQENYKPAKDNTPFTIVQAQLNNNMLNIVVRYTGGCKEHLFKLYTNKIFIKSQPPKLNLFLEHNPNEDLCKSLVIDTLIYDISKAKYTDTNTS